jgi:hypothetical protein
MQTRTVIGNIGHNGEGVDRLIEVLSEYALDRRLEVYGEFIDSPVWSYPEKSGWAIDGSDNEVSISGNFYEYSFAFNLTTNDPAIIATLREAIDSNQARPDYQAQPQPQFSLSLLREYLRDIGVCAKEYDDNPWPADVTEVEADDVEDPLRVAVSIHHRGTARGYVCDRRTLACHLIQMARSRRPSLGFTIDQVVGDMDNPAELTLAAALAAGVAS